MNIALLQPTFAPNLYDLACMLQADKVFLQNNEIWSRKSRVHRAKIRSPKGTQWINIPIPTEDRDKPISKVRIDNSYDWVNPVLKALRYNYRNSIYFDHYEPEIKADFIKAEEFKFLMPFCLYIRNRFFEFLQIERDFTLTSEISAYNSDPDLFVETVGADGLFQEHKSRHYMRQARHYKKEPIFKHPVYRQHFEGFQPYCCILDLLFQYGPESFKIIDQLTSSLTSK